ncbi:MAG: LysR family transcriptional regulator [Oscillospiraceae bacterium]|jgi:DNA-binding transcriptional LysR family regulator|nr:LysR family transcriptional regulator [Oscillospiraceae bacterium]
MTILQLRCFISLASTKKLTETAKQFNLGLPTLSKYIDHLEASYSAKLFHRSQGGLELTNAGELIYPSAQFVVRKYDEMLARLNVLANMDRSAMNVALAFHQPQLLRRLTAFSKTHPNIKLAVTEAPSVDIRALLDTMDIDFAITYDELLGKKYPHTLPIRNDRLVAVVGREHALAGRGSISVAELREDKFFLFKGDFLMYRFLIHTCISAGFVPVQSPHNFRVNTIMDSVAQNTGVSLLAESVANGLNNGRVAALALDESPCLTLSMVFPGEVLDERYREAIRQITDNG